MELDPEEIIAVEGLVFRREGNGHVRVRLRDTVIGTIAPAAWAILVASMSRLGNSDARHSAALTFHMDHGPAESHAEMMGRLAYAAYGAAVDYKNFAGKPMPQWPELPTKIREAWVITAARLEALVRGG